MNPVFLLFVLAVTVTAATVAQAADGIWREFKFSEPQEVVEYFHSIDYSIDSWNDGDRSVPRAYLTHIPASWRSHYAGELSTADKKRYFFFILAPMILHANETILQQRETLQNLQAKNQWLSVQKETLARIAEEYDLPAPADPSDTEAMAALLKRVDVVPSSMAMAQAAIESGWGTSRFASEGNALFGQWTWGEDAIAPARVRKELGNYGIRSFPTPFESIAAYIHNLNTHPAYSQFRDLRAQARIDEGELSGIAMAAGLEKYSERGHVYVEEVRSLIRFNKLEEIDEAYLRDNIPVRLIPADENV